MTERLLHHATIDDVARLAKVSIATVSRYINRTAKVSPATAARIEAAMIELAYQPTAAAQKLARGKMNTIGLVVDEISGEFFQPMLSGIQAGASDAGYDLLIYALRRTNQRNGRYALGEKNCDGLVVFADSLPDEELCRLAEKAFPMVLLHRSAPHGWQIPCVTIENKRGAREMVDYLIEQRGYRRIAFLQGHEGHEDSKWRETGYKESLAAHDIAYDERLVGYGGFSEDIAYETVTQWLRRGVKLDVIFAADDDSAIGAMFAIKKAKLCVPQDIAVVGFDDIRLANYLDPPLTTVRAPIEKVSRLAVEKLVDIMHGSSVPPITLLPTELIIRQSCGCC